MKRRRTYTLPPILRPVEGGLPFQTERIPDHPTRDAREWEVDCWEEDDEGWPIVPVVGVEE